MDALATVDNTVGDVAEPDGFVVVASAPLVVDDTDVAVLDGAVAAVVLVAIAVVVVVAAAVVVVVDGSCPVTPASVGHTITAPDGYESRDVPTALVAVRVNLYTLPLVRPVMASAVVDPF